MKTFLILCVIASALLVPARAQFTSDFQTVTTDSYGVLRGPTTFFTANSNRVWAIIGTSNYLADLAAKAGATNAVIVTATLNSPTITGSGVVASGGGLNIAGGAVLSGSPTASILFDHIQITADPFSGPGNYAAQKTYADIKGVTVVADLAALKALATPIVTYRIAIVRGNTGSDGAAGIWLWDFSATASETAVVVKSSLLSPSDAGRWIKLL